MLFSSLDTYLDRQGGFSKEKYLELCKQLGDTPDPNKIPISLSDFPFVVGQALDLHSQLGDRFATTDLGLLYLGKDYSTLPLLYKYNDVEVGDEQLILQLIQHIDSKAVKKSASNMKAASNKLKNARSKGK